MQSNILITPTTAKGINSNILETANIFTEMEMLGIDTAPFLEIAALDIINHFGEDALKHAAKIEQSFLDMGDINSAMIWGKITVHLNEIQIN